MTNLQRWNLYHQKTGNTTICFLLLKHFENDHEIVLEILGKLATGLNYNTTNKKRKFFKFIRKKIQTRLHQTFKIQNLLTRYIRCEKKRGIKNVY